MGENLRNDPYPQLDLFLPIGVAPATKGDQDSMEFPMFMLSSKPVTTAVLFEGSNYRIEIIPGNKVAEGAEGSGEAPTEVVPLATQNDKDLILFFVSHLVTSANRKQPVSPKIRVSAADMLRGMQRGSGGRDYKALEDALMRIRRTTWKVAWRSDDRRFEDEIRCFQNVRLERSPEGRLRHVEVELCNWLFKCALNREVLTYDFRYYLLRSNLIKRLYELARKHQGGQRYKHSGDPKSIPFSLAQLHKKCGSLGTLKHFRSSIRKLVEKDPHERINLLSFYLTYDEKEDQARFHGHSYKDMEELMAEEMGRSTPEVVRVDPPL